MWVVIAAVVHGSFSLLEISLLLTYLASACSSQFQTPSSFTITAPSIGPTTTQPTMSTAQRFVRSASIASWFILCWTITCRNVSVEAAATQLRRPVQNSTTTMATHAPAWSSQWQFVNSTVSLQQQQLRHLSSEVDVSARLPPKCACSPLGWEMVFDFSHPTCKSTNLPLHVKTGKPGLDMVSCREVPAPLERDHDDQLEYASDVQIREYNWQHVQMVVPHVHLAGEFVNGEFFGYHSIMGAQDIRTCTPDTCDMPMYIVFSFKAKTKRNQQEKEFEITWKFNHQCSPKPLVVKGHFVGPLTVVRVCACVCCRVLSSSLLLLLLV